MAVLSFFHFQFLVKLPFLVLRSPFSHLFKVGVFFYYSRSSFFIFLGFSTIGHRRGTQGGCAAPPRLFLSGSSSFMPFLLAAIGIAQIPFFGAGRRIFSAPSASAVIRQPSSSLSLSLCLFVPLSLRPSVLPFIILLFAQRWISLRATAFFSRCRGHAHACGYFWVVFYVSCPYRVYTEPSCSSQVHGMRSMISGMYG